MIFLVLAIQITIGAATLCSRVTPLGGTRSSVIILEAFNSRGPITTEGARAFWLTGERYEPLRGCLTPDFVLRKLPPAKRVRIEERGEDRALCLAADRPLDLRART